MLKRFGNVSIKMNLHDESSLKPKRFNVNFPL